MSTWVQVHSTLIVDQKEGETKSEFKSKMEKIFGKNCLWNAPKEIWNDAEEHPDQYLPMGSEGTLEMTIGRGKYFDQYAGNDGQLVKACWIVSINGGLRDRIGVDWINEWYSKALWKLRDEEDSKTRVNGSFVTYDFSVSDGVESLEREWMWDSYKVTSCRSARV